RREQDPEHDHPQRPPPAHQPVRKILGVADGQQGHRVQQVDGQRTLPQGGQRGAAARRDQQDGEAADHAGREHHQLQDHAQQDAPLVLVARAQEEDGRRHVLMEQRGDRDDAQQDQTAQPAVPEGSDAFERLRGGDQAEHEERQHLRHAATLRSDPMSCSSGMITEIATANTSGYLSCRSSGESSRQPSSATRNHSVHAGRISCISRSRPSMSALRVSCTIWKITYGTTIAVSRRRTWRGSLRYERERNPEIMMNAAMWNEYSAMYRVPPSASSVFSKLSIVCPTTTSAISRPRALSR